MLPSTMVSLAELRGTVLPRGCPVFSGPKRLPAVVVGHSEFGPVLSTPLNDDAFICLADALGEREVFQLFFIDRSPAAGLHDRLAGQRPAAE